MNEVVKINLDNEMDLILAHKRAMKIAELCGLPSSAQTRFSTAVSEIARCSIANGRNSVLLLGINVIRATQKEILAVLTDTVDLKKCSPEAYAYAAKISGSIQYTESGREFITQLSQPVSSPGLLSETKIQGFKEYFKFEPPLSPYDEIRKKNIELIALSEKLGESEHRYRQLTNTLPVLILMVDDRCKVLLVNNWLKDYLPVPLTIFDKTALADILHHEDVDTLTEGWNKARKGKSSYSGQVRVKNAASLYIWHLVSIIPNKTDDGAIINWLVFFVDINAQKIVEETLKDNTALKLIQKELEVSNARLSFKNKELEQFAFVTSHDLQEPLRKIRMMLSRAGENLTEQQRGEFYIDRMHVAAGRMSNLIADVLQYSRIDNNTLLFEEVDLNQITTEVISDLSLSIEEKDATIETGTLPTVRGISAQLRQLLFNLIANALKFNNAKPVVLISGSLCKAEDVPENLQLVGNYHLITVHDNGIGMDSQYSNKIFNMFQRLHDRDSYGGNGIGLALCKRIVENHNGAITFTSQLGEGTTFNIYLPC